MTDDFSRAQNAESPINSILNRSQLTVSMEVQDSNSPNAMEEMTWLGSFWLCVKRSTPTILTMVFFQMVQLLNIFFVGHVSSDLLAGVGLGNMLLNVLVFAITMGLNGTIETFVAWAYGKGEYKMCGTHLNRARVVVTAVISPVIILFLFIDKILIGLQQDPEIAEIARNYCVWTIPGWFCLVQFDSTKRFL
mmetsp:Transcript_21645/g.26587  ORF Transcript_21645/g.26587 Transcript_21645/m.26587 type:complete len:192 (-) Transcript_21645:1288-1863(-)